MWISEQLFGALIAEVEEAGEAERERFEATQGPYYGFNGTYCYLVTDRTLWQARLKARQLVGGAPDIKHWPLHACSVTREGKKVSLVTPDGEHNLAFPTVALAEQAIASLHPGE